MKLRVRTYLILAFILASGMPLAVFWVWPHARVVEAEAEKVSERHLLIAQNLSTMLGLYYRDLTTVMEAFGETIASGGAVEAAILFRNLNFRHICIAERETGLVKASYLAGKNPCPSKVPAERMALFNELVASGSVGMSRVFNSPDGKPRIYLATTAGEHLVVGAIHTDFFQRTIEQVKFGQQGHAVIIDQTGRVLAHPEAGWTDRAVSLAELPPVIGTLGGGSGVAEFYSPALQEHMISGFAAVPGAGWGVMVPQPIKELQEIGAQYDRDALLVLSVGLGFSLLLALAVSVQFSRRLGNIATGVNRVRHQEDGTRVEPSKDVIGVWELISLETDVNQLAEDSEATRVHQEAYNRQLEEANDKLRKEMSERRLAVANQRHSELRFTSLFQNAPIPFREEDLSGMKHLIDQLNIPDTDQFSAYLDAHPEFLDTCGKSIAVVDANEASLNLHGYDSKEDLLERVVSKLSPSAMKIVRMTAEAIHSGARSRSFETQITRLDGEVRTVQAMWSVVPGHEDDYSRILLSSVDLTDRLQSEEALRQAQKMEAVGQLTGGVAHDFNNLLTVIGGNLELLELDNYLDPGLAAPIKKAVRRGSELTQRLLAFSRKQPLMPRVIDLDELISGMLDLLRRSLGEEIRIKVERTEDTFIALADPGQVEAALLNLALNSRDAMPYGGELTISLSQQNQADLQQMKLPPGDFIVLSVADTGVGMEEDTRCRAVEPFYTTKEVGKGSGLGLSMVYGFAKQSGGDLLIESALGKGTVISLILPAATQKSARPEHKEPERLLARGSGQKVLILEDDDDVRDYMLKLVTSHGFEGIAAGSVEAASKILSVSAPIDVLISDIMLPGGTLGTEFATEVVRNHPHIGVVFISGRPSEANVRQKAKIPGAPLLTKPFDQHELITCIETALRSHAAPV